MLRSKRRIHFVVATNAAKLSAVIFALAGVPGAPSSAFAASGDIFALDPLPGGSSTAAYGINNSGDIAGGSTGHAVRFELSPGPGVAARDLGTLGGAGAVGNGVSGAGQVAGDSLTSTGDTHAFRYDGTPGSGGVMRDLGTLGGATSFGRGINSAGQVAGESKLANGISRAFRYDGTPGSGGVMRDLGTLGGDSSVGNAINDAGQVVGGAETGPGGSFHAFLYDGTPGQGGVMHDLGVLSGGGDDSQAFGVNNAGQVTGISGDHAFRYDGTPGAGGVMRDLGRLPGSGDTRGIALDSFGNVVGFGFTTDDFSDDRYHPFLYVGTPGAGGQMIDLDKWLNAVNPAEGARWQLSYAEGINDSGLVVGNGDFDPDGAGPASSVNRGFVLDVSGLVPEPTALSLLSATFGFLSLVRRGRPRRA